MKIVKTNNILKMWKSSCGEIKEFIKTFQQGNLIVPDGDLKLAGEIFDVWRPNRRKALVQPRGRSIDDVLPIMLLQNARLVKTRQWANSVYQAVCDVLVDGELQRNVYIGLWSSTYTPGSCVTYKFDKTVSSLFVKEQIVQKNNSLATHDNEYSLYECRTCKIINYSCV